MKLHINLIPTEFIESYQLQDIVDKQCFVHVEIRGSMHGLPQAGRLAHDQLVKHLAPCGHHPVRFTPGLWIHKERKTTFSLAVDDFGIKCLEKKDLEHLKQALETKHTFTLDYSESLCI